MSTVLVTGVGGNVGQGILRCIRDSFPDIRLVGTNTEYFNGASHLCEAMHEVPFAWDEGFADRFVEIAKSEKVDLILPATDFEAYHLGTIAERLPCSVAVSPPKTTSVYLDKYLTWNHHSQFHLPFAETCLPSEYENQFEKWIVKPRKGRGSRGLHICPESMDGFSDDEYMVQKLAIGREVTTAFYVCKSGKLHGHVTMERELSAGATVKCRVVREADSLAEALIKEITAHADFCGSANVQSILSEDGKLVPFEVNCRISGTNSIRHHFGFQDVVYTIQEYLLDQKPDQPNVKNGVAMRLLMDVIYSGATEYPKPGDPTLKGHLE